MPLETGTGDWSAGLGEMAALVRAHDRTATPLGRADAWPRAWTAGEAGPVRMVAERTRDAMAHARAAAGLKAGETRSRLMADAVPQIVGITDADGRLEFFKRQWADYVGAPDMPATAGDVAAAYVHPDDGPVPMERFAQGAAHGRRLRGGAPHPRRRRKPPLVPSAGRAPPRRRDG